MRSFFQNRRRKQGKPDKAEESNEPTLEKQVVSRSLGRDTAIGDFLEKLHTFKN